MCLAARIRCQAGGFVHVQAFDLLSARIVLHRLLASPGMKKARLSAQLRAITSPCRAVSAAPHTARLPADASVARVAASRSAMDRKLWIR